MRDKEHRSVKEREREVRYGGGDEAAIRRHLKPEHPEFLVTVRLLWSFQNTGLRMPEFEFTSS